MALRVLPSVVAKVVGIVVSSAMAATVLAAAPGAARPAAAEPSLDTSTEDGALRAARDSGEPVEVSGLRTTTRRVFAEPSGVLRMEQSLRPRWVRQDDAWVGVDPTLRREPDGTVGPVASVLGLRFSGGGQERPLAEISDGGQSMAFNWPGTLPEPRLDGDTASYPEVLPGVDLQVRADIEGFVWALVVKTPEAAENPELRRITLGTSGRGMSVRENPHGGVDVLDASGGLVLVAATPIMWDSSDTAASGTPERLRASGEVPPRLEGPAVGARRQAVEVDVGAGELSVIPDQAMLGDPATKFPVVIDPPFTVGRVAWAKVSSGFPDQEYPNGGIDGPYGEAGHAGDASQKWRTFYRFNIYPTLHGKQILSSYFHIYVSHSWSCEDREVQAWRTGGFSSGTNWSNQPAWQDYLASVNTAKGYNSSCPGGSIKFNVKDAVSAAAAGRWSTLTLGVKAEDETDNYAWKKFKSTYDLTKIVTEYNSVPRQPALSDMRTQPGGWCSGGSLDKPIPINKTNPTVYARLFDADSTVKGLFEIREYDPAVADPLRASWTSPLNSTNREHQWQVPTGSLVDGKVYRLNVKAIDEHGAASAFSLHCWIKIDTTNPQRPPSVTSTDYPSIEQLPEGNEGAGHPGRFVLAANGDTDVTAFRYGLDDPDCSQGPVNASTPGGTQTVLATPRAVGPRVMYAASVDAAGNWSDCVAVYTFEVKSGAAPVSHFKFDENTGTAAQDAKATGRTATLAGGAGWAAGRVDGAVSLNGTTAYAATSGPVADTSKAFTISAWVRLTKKDANYTALSQAGSVNSGFQLYYSSSYDRWIFNRHGTDSQNSAITRAIGSRTPDVNAWTHLLGVYDPGDKQIRLYVNGRLEGWAAFTTPWNATGGLQIGRLKYNGAFGENFPGQVDNVRIWQRVVVESALEPEAYFQLDEENGAPPQDLIYEGRTLTLGTGAIQADNAKYGRGLTLNGTGNAHATTPTEAVRTDQAFSVSAWVKLTNKNVNMSMLSQAGTRASGFQLYYSKSSDRWIFNRHVSDTDDTQIIRATSTTVPTLSWTHLLGVHDPVAKQIRLYVDGRLEASVAFTTPWHASGQLQVGRSRWNGAWQENLNGGIDEVKVWDYAIDDDPYRETGPPTGTQDPADPQSKSEIWREANLPVQLTGHWKLNPPESGPGDGTAPSEHGNTKPLTLQGGAQLLADDQVFWTADGMGFLNLDGVDDQTVGPPGLLRTDRSFSVAAWVRVTNVPESWSVTKPGATVLSQDGAVNSGFKLYAARYNTTDVCDPEETECFRWTFSANSTDDNTVKVYRAQSSDVVQYEPTHLAGVYDMSDRQMRLYVNGQLVRSAQVPFTTAWAAMQQFRIGTGKYKGSFANDFFPGQVDEVSLYAGVLTREDVLQVMSAAYPIDMVH